MSAFIHYAFSDQDDLHAAYMPFIIGGGLFVRTSEAYLLGDKIQLSVQLMNEPEAYLVSGQVVWVTPQNAQGNKPQGIGVQFTGETSLKVAQQIQSYLAQVTASIQSRDTF